MSLRGLFLLPLLLALTACETWKPGGTPVTRSKEHFTLTLPAGWYSHSGLGLPLLASREGVMLHQIRVEVTPLAKALPASKHNLSPTVTAFELAEALVHELSADRSLHNLRILSRTTLKVSGRELVRLEFEYSMQESPRLREVRYGIVANNSLYLLRYYAPARFYFERDLMAFETTAKSLQIQEK